MNIEEIKVTLESLSTNKFENLRLYMKENNITYTSLGTALGITRQNAFNLLHAKNMTVKSLVSVVNALKNLST